MSRTVSSLFAAAVLMALSSEPASAQPEIRICDPNYDFIHCANGVAPMRVNVGQQLTAFPYLNGSYVANPPPLAWSMPGATPSSAFGVRSISFSYSLPGAYTISMQGFPTPAPDATVYVQSATAVSEVVFPTSANVAGLYFATFKTKMTIVNPNSTPITISAQLATPDGLKTATIAVAGHQVITWPEFLGSVFGYTGGAGIHLKEAYGQGFIATAEVYVDGQSGRYSTPLPNLTSNDSLNNAVGSRFLVSGLVSNALNRVNVGCSNLSSQSAAVRIWFFSAPGQANPSFLDLTLNAFQWAQQPVTLQGDQILVAFSLSGTGAPEVYCYGVNVNNGSNDGTLVPTRHFVNPLGEGFPF